MEEMEINELLILYFLFAIRHSLSSQTPSMPGG
jgi:hypothetical protein